MVSPPCKYSKNTSRVRSRTFRSGAVRRSPGDCSSITLLMRYVREFQLGGGHNVPCLVPYRNSSTVEI